MEQASGENSCGSAIATTILCSIFVVLVSAISFWAIYNLYWKRKYGIYFLIRCNMYCYNQGMKIDLCSMRELDKTMCLFKRN